MILKAIVCGIDVICALSCFMAVVADDTERRMRIVDLLIALGMIANIYLIWSAR